MHDSHFQRRRRFPHSGRPANTAEILKFLIDRTGYIKLLEEEDTPEAFRGSRTCANWSMPRMDSKDRGETLDQFLDHAALVSDADAYDESAQITLMTLHAAKGLEFPLVFLCGLEEGLFPHSRTFLETDDIEEERRLCYVGMTRAMDTLVLTRAVYRRRYGTDLPEASVPSRFLEEVPAELMEELGGSRRRPWMGGSAGGRRTGVSAPQRRGYADDHTSSHYSYEDEDQSAAWQRERAERPSRPTPARATTPSTTSRSSLPRGERNSACRRPSSRSPKARKASARGRKSAIRNTARAPSTSEKEMGKTPRLRYNSLASG